MICIFFLFTLSLCHTQFEKVDILVLSSLAKRQVAKMSPSRCQFGSNDIMFVLRVQLAQINTQQTDYENLMPLARGIPHHQLAPAPAPRGHMQAASKGFWLRSVFSLSSLLRVQRGFITAMPRGKKRQVCLYLSTTIDG